MSSKRLCLFLSYFFIILLTIPLCYGYWGNEGDCQDYHNITKIEIPYDKDAIITLDGIPSEPFWRDPQNNNGMITVPLASKIGKPGFFIIYLNLTVIMNDNYIYLLCEWNDNSTRPYLSNNIYDGLFFCWDINVPDFSADFWDGMETDSMGGGRVDSWGWICNGYPPSTPGNGSSYFIDDRCFDENGWCSSFESSDVAIGYTYRENKSYIVELSRELYSDDEYDVQIIKKELYKFNLAILNDGTHEDHAISWTYALDLTENTSAIIGYNFIIVVPIIFISVIVLIQKFKKKIDFINRKE